MPFPDEKYFNALHDDLKSLNEKVYKIELSLAEMSGEKMGAKIEKHDAKITALEEFKSKLIGALIIIQVFWGLVAGVLGGFIIWTITHK